MSLHELREARRVSEAERCADPGDRYVGVGEEAADLERDAIVEHLLGCLTDCLVARSIEGARAVTERGGTRRDRRPEPQVLFEVSTDTDVRNGQLSGWRRSAHESAAVSPAAPPPMTSTSRAPSGVVLFMTRPPQLVL